jgi:hypothetical protein
MPELKKAQEPFRFFTRLNLTELTGLKARNLAQLLELLREVPGSSIYHHTHRFLQQHQYHSPEPPNDFAYWVTENLGEDVLGERLASIDIVQFSEIRRLRERIIEEIEVYLREEPSAQLRFAREGQEFHFMKSLSFFIPTPHVAYDLAEFAEVLKKITIDSIYFHIFEARLRVGKGMNDFSNWFSASLDEKDLAADIARLDPYTQTLEDLRQRIIGLIESRIGTAHA